MITNSFIFVLVLSLIVLTSNADPQYRKSASPWDLPLLPANPQIYPNYTASNESKNKIPRLIWIGFRKAPGVDDNITAHVLKMQKTNFDFTFHLWGNEEEHHFMETYFFNTSILWAFKHVNPAVGVSYSDIWRLCVLWAYGGFYIDDDSYIDTPLNKIIRENDTLILSNEKGSYHNCYQPYYQLSDTSLLKKHNLLSNSTTLTDLYSSRNIVNWALFSNPRNKLIEKALENIVDIFKFEYLKRPVFNTKPYDPRFMKVFCSTGPTLLTATARQFALEHPGSPDLPRMVESNEFKQYGSIVKVSDDSVVSHYMKRMDEQQLNLLSAYQPFLSLESLETRFVVAKQKIEMNNVKRNDNNGDTEVDKNKNTETMRINVTKKDVPFPFPLINNVHSSDKSGGIYPHINGNIDMKPINRKNKIDYDKEQSKLKSEDADKRGNSNVNIYSSNKIATIQNSNNNNKGINSQRYLLDTNVTSAGQNITKGSQDHLNDMNATGTDSDHGNEKNEHHSKNSFFHRFHNTHHNHHSDKSTHNNNFTSNNSNHEYNRYHTNLKLDAHADNRHKLKNHNDSHHSHRNHTRITGNTISNNAHNFHDDKNNHTRRLSNAPAIKRNKNDAIIANRLILINKNREDERKRKRMNEEIEIANKKEGVLSNNKNDNDKQSNNSNDNKARPLHGDDGSSTSTGANEISSGGTGFNFYRIKNSKLIKYPDMCSFLSAYVENIEIDAPVNIETVDMLELYSLFKIGSKSESDNDKNSNKDINENRNVYYESPPLPFYKIISGKQAALYLVEKCHKHSFPNMDTFLAMKFTNQNVSFLPLEYMEAIKMGKMLRKQAMP